MKITRVAQSEVRRLSMVREPANQDYICSDVVCNIDGHYITSVVLRANQKIYRGDDERFFYYPLEAIDEAAHGFLERAQNQNLSINHSPFITEGLKLSESWVEDGVWRVRLKVEDEDILSDIHSGDLRGISIEAIAIEDTIMEFETEEEFILQAEQLIPLHMNEIFGEFNI